jgi:hypothetical protein
MKVMANRVLLTFKAWEDRKKEMEPLLKAGSADERILARLQLDHLRKANHRLNANTQPDEKPFMTLLNSHMIRLEKQLYPNLLRRLFSRLNDRFLDGPAYLKQQAQQRTDNIESLKAQLKASGLSSVAGRLENHLNLDHKKISLPLDCRRSPDERLNFDLHFEQDPYGNFQLNRLHGSLLHHKKMVRSHQFELNDWPNLKSNQALSLLEGRAMKQQYIDASGHQNHRWVELGPKGVQHYHPEHPFDVKTALTAMPSITGNKEELIRYMENGQQIPTHCKQGGQFQSIFIQADPANQTLKLFDAKQKAITTEQLVQKAQQPSPVKKLEVPAQRLRKGVKNGYRH